MPDATNIPAVDMAALQADIDKLSPTEMAAELLKTRTRQKTQQKKQYAKGTMKAYQQKSREKFKAMKEKALATPATEVDPTTGQPYANLWAQINAKAEVAAEAKLEEIAAEGADEETEEATQ